MKYYFEVQNYHVKPHQNKTHLDINIVDHSDVVEA